MGMFDSFQPKEALRCPLDGEELDDWQSKVGPCEMATFYEGDAYYKSWGGMTRLDGSELPYRFRIYTSHDEPEWHWVEAEVTTDKGVWADTRLIEVTTFDSESRDVLWSPDAS